MRIGGDVLKRENIWQSIACDGIFEMMRLLRCEKKYLDGTASDDSLLFLLDMSFLLWHMLISFTFGLVGIWKLAYIEATYAQFYNVLAYPSGEYPLDEEDEYEE